MKIINRFTGETIIEGDYQSHLEAIGAAMKNGADLRSADLRSANLYGADLYGADLRSADLYGADLRSADLRSADLYGANLYGANLYGANFYGAKIDFRIMHFGPCGSVNQITQFIPSINEVKSGCWQGSLEAFEEIISKKFSEGSELRLLFDAGLNLFRQAAQIEQADPKPMIKPS